MRLRGFEVVSKYNNQVSLDGNSGTYKLESGETVRFSKPSRATSGSAAYDIFNNTGSEITLAPGESVTITTFCKSYMLGDELLTLWPRSGHGFKYLVRLANTAGIIDSDYYNNENNEGEIFVKLTNPERGGKVLVIPHGEAMCQGTFTKVLFTDDDYLTHGGTRAGGIGSTNKRN